MDTRFHVEREMYISHGLLWYFGFDQMISRGTRMLYEYKHLHFDKDTWQVFVVEIDTLKNICIF